MWEIVRIPTSESPWRRKENTGSEEAQVNDLARRDSGLSAVRVGDPGRFTPVCGDHASDTGSGTAGGLGGKECSDKAKRIE